MLTCALTSVAGEVGQTFTAELAGGVDTARMLVTVVRHSVTLVYVYNNAHRSLTAEQPIFILT